MPEYTLLYGADGAAVGFRRHHWVYKLDGTPIGMTRGNHVYQLSGHYIGEIQDDMVVDAGAKVPDTSAPGSPQNPGSVNNPQTRPARTDVKDTFQLLIS